MQLYKIKFTRKDGQSTGVAICGASDLAAAVNGVLDDADIKVDRFISIEQFKEDVYASVQD